MPKDGFLAPKAIANRIKAKGLQKLRWYCQMCNKQCRDENGFKCHTMSESHLRQMDMFSENSGKFMDEFSREFEEGMMEIIRRKARSQRQNANQLYRDYIADKQHFHMNATIWETLTDFVMYLGRKGLCEVDETEKGWFVTYIDRDPETLARMEARAKRERNELDSEEKHQREIQRMVKKARANGEVDGEPTGATELQRSGDEAKISIGGLGAALVGGGKARMVPRAAVSSAFGDDDDDGGKVFSSSGAASGSVSGCGRSSDSAGGGAGGGARLGSSADAFASKKPMSAAEQLMIEERGKKERTDARTKSHEQAEAGAERAPPPAKVVDYWLALDIVVKCVDKKLQGGAYYKQKGRVEKLVDRYTAHVRMAQTGDLLKLDQDDLETVIPAAGGRVLLVNGADRGAIATVLAIDEERFSVRVQLESGRVLEAVEYEHVCKYAG